VGTPVLLYLLALLVRALAAAGFPDPAYPDSFYYVDAARAMAAGQGMAVDFVWIFAEVGGRLPAQPTLPIPAFGHWMPLAALVQVPVLWLFGPVPLASVLPFVLVGALVAPLAWAIARDAGLSAWAATAAGVLAAVPGLLLPFLAQPDNFGLYEPIVAGALWLTSRALRGDGRAFVGAAVLAGLAVLSRNDGWLVVVVLVLAAVWDRRLARGTGSARPIRIDARALAGAALAVGLLVGPWYARQLATFGTLSPSAASGKALFIRDIGEWNSIATPADLGHLLGMGPGPLIASRLLGVVAAAGIFAVLVGGIVLVPLALIGAWRRRRSVVFGPFLAYGVLLFAFSGFVSAVHVPGGTFIHSAVALAPHTAVLAVDGIVAAVAWAARRRPVWRPAEAERVFLGGAVLWMTALAAVGTPSVHDTWAAKRERMIAVAAALDRAGAAPTDRLMAIDAAGYRYHTGRGGIVLPNDPLSVIETAARAYDVRWLVLERDDSVAAVAPILLDDARPDWIGPAIWRDGARVAVYPVCTTPGDGRCQATASGGGG
jgi:hypothetical protein